MEEAIRNLMSIGYGRTDAEAALRAAYGDPDRAYEYLMSGVLPTNEEMEAEDRNNYIMHIIRNILSQRPEALEEVIQMFEANQPSIRENVTAVLQSMGLDPANYDVAGVRNRTAVATTIVRAYLQQHQQQLQHPPQQAPQPQQYYQQQPQPQARPQPAAQPRPAPGPPAPPSGEDEILSRYSPEDREALIRIKEFGSFRLLQVIQAFEVCNKDENLAVNLLFQWATET
jgi:UV excision repair protein RAD23